MTLLLSKYSLFGPNCSETYDHLSLCVFLEYNIHKIFSISNTGAGVMDRDFDKINSEFYSGNMNQF
jgi:hypothetical protein